MTPPYSFQDPEHLEEDIIQSFLKPSTFDDGTETERNC